MADFNLMRGCTGSNSEPPFGPGSELHQGSDLGTRQEASFLRIRPAEAIGTSQFANFTIVVRVIVTFLVTAFGPPLNMCHAEYCSL